MANKIFSIYSDRLIETDQQSLLLVEIAPTHIACIVKQHATASISAFELFGFKDGELETDQLFAAIKPHSRLLNELHGEVKIFIQNSINVLVPASLHSEASALTFLDAATGMGKQVTLHNETLSTFGGIVNVFGLEEALLQSLQSLFPNATIVHTYSQLLRTLKQAGDTNGALLKVQFYNSYFIVLVTAANRLLLLQTLEYESPSDVLYHLLNISKQLLENANPDLEISGMIDLDSPLYLELKKYFLNVRVEEANQELFHFDASEFPAHYFAPIVNLAV